MLLSRYIKKGIFFILLLNSLSAYSQLGISYECKIVVNNVCTGFTNVMTIEVLPGEEVKVTRTTRLSRPDDIFASYSLIGSPFVVNSGTATIHCDEDTWLIPFEGELRALMVAHEDPVLSCSCTGEGVTGSCEVVPVGDNTTTCREKPDDYCTGCCYGKITFPNPNIGVVSGGGIFLHAKNVILVEN